MEMHEGAGIVVANSAVTEDCQAVTATLNERAPLEQLTDLLAGVGDTPLREYLSNETVALADVLAHCLSPTSPPSDTAIAELQVAEAAVKRRLADMGWTR
ncbi:hypothetical protein [Pseudonocardia sp. NPDC049635]|uniref:hypothetical protein n=1 Tax=Pseudonocardia sp. NPDC049635 TaxID=3155506 RepID=UPI0033C9C348